MRHTFVGRTLVAALAVASVVACNERDSKPNQNAPAPSARSGARSEDEGRAGADATECMSPGGQYLASFTERSGNCGALGSDRPFSLDNNITIEKFADVDVETESVVMSCSLLFKQLVRNKTTGVVAAHLHGPELAIEPDGSISGAVSLRRFDERGAMTCSGEYDAIFEKSSSTIGAAATTP
jgi:hypothetical protein